MSCGRPAAVFAGFRGARQRLEKARVSSGLFPCRTCAAGRAGLQTRGEEVLSVQLAMRLKVNARPSLRGKLVSWYLQNVLPGGKRRRSCFFGAAEIPFMGFSKGRHWWGEKSHPVLHRQCPWPLVSSVTGLC